MDNLILLIERTLYEAVAHADYEVLCNYGAHMRITDDNYFIVQGWMITQLGLKGTDLLVYAVVYGFSQDGETEFTGSLQYLSDFCGGISRPTVISSLKRLTEGGLIEKNTQVINGVTFNRYKAILQGVKKFNSEHAEGGKNSLQGGKKSLPNKEVKNNKCVNKEYYTSDSEFEELWNLYPRKDGKKAAKNAYIRALKNGATTYIIKQGIARYLTYIRQNNVNPRYIKMGSTWFNGECWNDDYGGAVIQDGYNNGVTDDLDEIFGGGKCSTQ